MLGGQAGTTRCVIYFHLSLLHSARKLDASHHVHCMMPYNTQTCTDQELRWQCSTVAKA